MASNTHSRCWGAALLVAAACSLPAVAWAEDIDTVFLVGGGRVRGQIMVEDEKVVSVKLADGKTRELARATVLRVEYAGDHPKVEVSAAVTTTEPGPEPVEPPAKKKRRRYVADPSMLNSDDPPVADPRQEDADGAKRRSAQAMVISGAVFTALGWSGVIAGAMVIVVNAVGNGDGTVNAAGAVIIGGSTAFGITGSVVLGVGRARLKKLPREALFDGGFDPGEAFAWADARWSPPLATIGFAF